MLLRSYSAPIISSSYFLPHSMDEQEQLNRHIHRKHASPRHNLHQSIVEEKTEQKFYKKKTTPTSIKERFSSCGLDKQILEHEEGGKKGGKLQTLVMGGGMGCDGGRICGNGWENNYGRDETDAYYKNMIDANPNNSLLLGNYAKFLKEVRGDYDKAEEYVERAILANPCYGDALSLYADLIWQTNKNVDRAKSYFDRAVQSDPNDCYVLASYAKFLWNAEEDDEDNECQQKTVKSNTYIDLSEVKSNISISE